MNALFAHIAQGAGPSGRRAAAEPNVCIPNIGPAEQRKRLRFGLVALAVGIALTVVLIWSGISPLYRLALFVPYAMAGSGYFQARDKT
jgi:hypothetical protein